MRNFRISHSGMDIFLLLFVFIFGIILASCGDSAGTGIQETITSGRIRISVDESFKPVMDSQVKVFEAKYPDAKIVVDYKPEAECLRDLMNDSVRLVIVTRAPTREEEKLMTDKYKFKPAFGTLAVDAVALIVNNQSKDTFFTIPEIQGMLRGKSNFKYKVLLDGARQTSTVRYVRDSLLKGEALSKNVVGAANSEAVIEYVSNHNDAIGMIGVSWIGNSDDTAQLSFLEKIKLAQIECRDCNGTFVHPYLGNIALGKYPMVRPLYYVLKENYRGLGSGFANFLIYEKGQLIFKRAYLLPTRMPFDLRNMSITE
ncbi:PstS family phosphate ABC transporter substrate-binding protein [Flavitalea sp.]|nr:substrate-binding domain-containing protein [Flavitalea sp.]